MSHSNSHPETQAVSDLLLLRIRSATLRAKLDASELMTVGIALRAGWITPGHAVKWLHDRGLVDQVIVDEVRS